MASYKVHPPIAVGDRFGRLVVTSGATPAVTPRGRRVRRWVCLCDCGAARTIRDAALKSGATTGCGCRRREIASTLADRSCRTHGDARARSRAPEYGIYRAMLSRCFNPRVDRFPVYGGRGITVCDRWRGPEGYPNFLADMGRRPTSGHSLDRIDPDGDYAPGNVRWATTKVQAHNRTNNRRIEYRGEVLTLTQAAELSGVGRSTLANRLNAGWPVERAMSAPLRRRCRP